MTHPLPPSDNSDSSLPLLDLSAQQALPPEPACIQRLFRQPIPPRIGPPAFVVTPHPCAFFALFSHHNNLSWNRWQVDYMLDKFQSMEAIAGQLRESYEYWTVLHNDRSAGYVAVVPNRNEPSLLLSKIYVRKAERGHGLGRETLRFVEALCLQRGIGMIWLTVNKNNTRSIAWYSRLGFRNAGPTVQDIGGGFQMDDFRMEKTIGRERVEP